MTTAAVPSRPSLSLWLIAAIFIAAGILHFVKPAAYVAIMPRWLPAPLVLVYVSGVFQILGGLGVLPPVTRQLAGWGLIALLVAIFPANVQMLLDARASQASLGWQAALMGRLPLQALLIAWVYFAAVRDRR